MRIADALDIARLVLVGDSRQLRAVDAGQPFRQLQQAGMTTAMMDDIRRQRDPDLRAAVLAVLAGEPGEAVELLGSSVHEVAFDELAEKAAEAWLELAPEVREQTLLVAPTHELRARINRTVREALADEGVLRGRPFVIERLVSLGMTRSEKADLRNYREDDAVVFSQDLVNYRVMKDEVLTVTGLSRTATSSFSTPTARRAGSGLRARSATASKSMRHATSRSARATGYAGPVTTRHAAW